MSESYLNEIKDSIANIISSSNAENSDSNALIVTLFEKIDKTNQQQNDIVVDLIINYLIRLLNIINAKDLDTSFQYLLKFLKHDHTIQDKRLISKIVGLLNKFTTEFDLVNINSPYFYEFKYFFISKYCIMSFYGNFLYNNPTETHRFKYNDTLLSNASRNYNKNASLIEKYNNAMSLLDNPAMTILNTLHSRFNGSFNNNEDAISPNSKTIINVITTCMEAFQERIRYFKKFNILEAFNDVNTLSLSIQDFYKTLKLKEDVFENKNTNSKDHLEFIANSEYSSVDDLQFLFEPITENLSLEDLKLDIKIDLKDLSPDKMTLVANSVVYVKFLITVFLIKVRVFLRYLQDFRTLFSDIYAIFANNPSLLSGKALEDVKNTIKNSIMRNSLHFLKNVLSKEYKNFSQQVNYKNSTSSSFIDTSLELVFEHCEVNSYDFKNVQLTNSSYTTLGEPKGFLEHPYFFKKKVHERNQDTKFENKTNNENLIKKFDEMKELAYSGPIDKTQDDWCAFNVLYKFSPSEKNVEISKLENFKHISFDNVMSKVYDENSFNETKEKLKKEIEDITSKQSKIQVEITNLKEVNKKFGDMMYMPNAEFIQVYKTEFETKEIENEVLEKEDNEKIDYVVKTIEKSSCLKEHSGQSNHLGFKSYPQRILTQDEDEDIFVDTKKQHLAASEASDKKPLRQSRRVQSQEEVSINEDGVVSKIQFLLPKKSYKENAISDDYLENEVNEDNKFTEAKKNLQLKEAELSENMDSTVEEEESLKSEYDEICLKNTAANNFSNVSDLKTLKKYKALDTEELKTFLEPTTLLEKRRLRSSSQEPEDIEESDKKRVKLSE
ncbi:hypothetical protein DAHU10_028220 [Hanseniaspora uvarum]|nr:hypothetical protein DAHU10_028220 [Hanseniaspora uvarum]